LILAAGDEPFGDGYGFSRVFGQASLVMQRRYLDGSNAVIFRETGYFFDTLNK